VTVHIDKLSAFATFALIVATSSWVDGPELSASDAIPGEVSRRLGKVKLQQGWPISCMVFSPDSRLLVTGYWERSPIRIWNVSKKQETHCIKSVGDIVRFSPETTTLAAVDGPTIKIWSIATGRCLKTLRGSDRPVHDIAYSPDGKYLISGGEDQTVRIWDTQTGAQKRILKGIAGPINCVVVTHDGKHLIAGTSKGKLVYWNLMSGVREREMKVTPAIQLVTLSPNGRFLAVHAGGGDIRVLDSQSGQEIRRLQATLIVASLVYSPDSRVLVVNAVGHPWSNSFQAWDLRTGKRTLTLLAKHHEQVLAFSPDGESVAIGTVSGSVRLKPSKKLGDVETETGHRDPIHVLGYREKGTMLVTGSIDGTARLWDCRTGKEVRSFSHGGDEGLLALSPDARFLASLSSSRLVRLWDTTCGRLLRTYQSDQTEVTCLGLSRKGRILAVGGSHGLLEVWDTLESKKLHHISSFSCRVNAVSCAPDGKTFVSGDYDGTVRLWNTKTGGIVWQVRLSGRRAQAFTHSPTGRFIAVATADGRALLLEAASGRTVKTIVGHRGTIYAVGFLGTKRLVTAGEDKFLRIWDLATAKQIRELEGHSGPIRTLAVSNEMRQLSTGSDDSTILIWNIHKCLKQPIDPKPSRER
jgi:WD40 repeat protein